MRAPAMDVRRSAQRYVTRAPGVDTRHCFSFGRHYDPANTSFGRLVLLDEHRLEPGAGFDRHLHRDLDIVTWVLDGELVHEDDSGTSVVSAGGFQRLLAGPGVVHAERAGAAGARLVQLWLTAAQRRTSWSYEHGRVPVAAEATALTPEVRVVRVHPGRSVVLPQAPLLHLFVGRGTVSAAAQTLAEGDSARLVRQPDLALEGDGEVLVVEMNSTPGAE